MYGLKIRAWDKYNKKMWYSKDDYTPFLDHNNEEWKFRIRCNPTTGEIQAVTESLPYLVDSYPYPKYDIQVRYHDVMVFVGQQDKNNKDIYEGDIREGVFYDSISAGGLKYVVRQVIKWNENSMCFDWVGPYIPEFCGINVIGNIYENPELLNNQT